MLNSKKHIPIQLTWQNVSCALEQTSGLPFRRTTNSKQILQGVNGFAKPGSVVAIVGSSGAGKSTLLDILSGRKNLGKIDGDILINGSKRNARFKRVSAYVTQEDILMPLLTVYETLMFYMKLKNPKEGQNRKDSAAIRHESVMEMIEELSLEKVTNVRVGDENNKGISGGEKKRLCIGCEMISDPSLMFLDEPTTGLDAFNSQQVMFTLKKLAASGRTIICTLHQPRSSIFSMFDSLLCLSEGRVVYFGEAKGAVEYFEREIGDKCSAYFNPADYIIDLALMDERRRFALRMGLNAPPEKRETSLSGETSLADVFARSALCRDGLNELESLASKTDQDLVELSSKISEEEEAECGRAPGEPFVIPEVTRFAIPWHKQFAYLMERQFKDTIRAPQTSVLAIFQAIFMSLFYGSLFYGTPSGPRKDLPLIIGNVEGILFSCMLHICFSGMECLYQILRQRKLFMKEKAAGLYRVSAYYMAISFSDISSLLLAPVLFCIIVYYFVGFRPSPDHFFTFIAILMVLAFMMKSYFVMCGSLTKNPEVAASISVLPILIFFLFGGFFVAPETIPSYLAWLQYLSPFKYAFSALLLNQLLGYCMCDNVDQNNCPHNCQGDTYIDCGDGGLCLLGSGVLALWNNVYVLMGMMVIYRILGYIALTLNYRQRR